uniref:Bifunctional inhibitor/plant lipid transfer protein/seed storage helical domain-containing protein n=1 Tax=Glycine max TaxID=3847 RepID=C6T1Q7_SOYBN|nr:unknown [Glycine max]
MTKLTILLIALLFIAHTCCASKWQQHQQESCREQLKGINLNPCEHIMEKIQAGRRGEDGSDEDHILIRTMSGRINYIRKKEGKEEEEEGHMQKCCSEMSELKSPICQCKALQKIMDNQSEQLEGKEKKQMERELMNLAIRCRLGPMIGCDLSSDD